MPSLNRRSPAALILAGLAAISLWLSAGTVAVTGDVSRIAALPSIWILIALVVVAVGAAAWTRLSLPGAWPLAITLLIWLPFLPGRVPAAFLLIQGPAEWIAWTLAIIGLIVARPVPRFAAWADPKVAPWIAAALLLAASFVTFRSVPDVVPGGDEPHYLAATQSLLRDFDLKVENNYANGDYLAYFPGRLEPHFLKRSTSGEIYSIHAPGVSVIVLPAFAIAGYGGAVFVMMLCAALAAAMTWRLAWRVSGSAAGAWVGVSAVFLTAPYFFHTFTIYPEIIGSFCVVGAIWLLIELDDGREVSGRSLVVVSTLLATLPWLHSRFAVLAALLGVFIIARLAKRSNGAAQIRRFVVVPVVAAAAWFGFFWAIWGSANPASPYGADTSTSASYILRGLIGLLIDQQFGILVTAPVFLAAFAGLGELARRRPRLTFELAILTLVYASAVASYAMWWAGSAAPARFLVAILPLAALPIALAGRHVVTWLLLTVSVVMIVPRAFVEGGRFIFNGRSTFDATLEWLSTSADLAAALPSVHRDGGMIAVRDAAVWIVLLTLAVLAVSRYVKQARGAQWTIASWVMAVAALIASTTVWIMHGVTPIRIERSKLAALSEYRPRWHTMLADLSGLGTTTEPQLMQALALSVNPASVRLVRVPPGEYDLTSRTGDSATVTMFVGRNDPPIETLRVDRGSPARLRVPVSLQTLNLVTKGAPDDQAVGLGIAPVAVTPGAFGQNATHAIRYGRSRAFFFDERAYPERDGFWVRAHSSVTVVVDTDDAVRRSGLPISITAGAVPTTVELSVGAWRESFALNAGQQQQLTLPPAANGTWTLSIRSGAGFRPSERDPASRDVRLLGAWIAIQ